MGCWERVNKILAAENPIKEPIVPTKLSSFDDCIKFENVDFHYTPANKVLKNINLTLEKGRTIALVGQSGSGKSTLVDLVPRFHDVIGGTITIDGKDIRKVPIKELRSLIGNVNQEAILFNDTFYNNITRIRPPVR